METVDKIALERKVIDVLKSCFDPEIPTNIYDLGLIYEINIDNEANVHTIMTLTSPSCPVAETLPPEVEEKIRNIPGLISSKVEVTWDPTWSKDMMSETAQFELGMM
jgi:FeS assembly SUF system protein